MNNINFKGSFIHNINIKKLENDQYVPHKASFVEMNPKDKRDVSALEKIANSWFGLYDEVIYNGALHDSLVPPNRERRFYVLTEQTDTFEKMDYKKILGVVEFSKLDDHNYVDFLQTNPKYIKEKPKKNFFGFTKKSKINNKKYSSIGSAILTSLKKISDNSIGLHALTGTEDFYKRNGFKRKNLINFMTNYYFWKKVKR